VWSLNDEVQHLRRLAKQLLETGSHVYDSKFIKIYHELQKHLKISQALKAGSLGKKTKIELYGDMDFIFTIDTPIYNDDQKMRKLIEEKMQISFGRENVELKIRSVLINFQDDFSVDVVYLNKHEFEKEKKQIQHIKSVSDEVRDIIILAKYVKYKKNLKNMKSYKIEWNAIYSSAQTFDRRLRDTLHKSGAGEKTKEFYDFILKEARGN